jgi:uncharacterized protein (DUF1697 family)
VPSHLALLRGINVGGRNRLAMEDLAGLMRDLGHTDVATYIQSGNVLFTPAVGARGTDALAGAIAGALAERLSVSATVVVLTAQELEEVISANPFPGVGDPRHLHAVIHQEPLPSERMADVAGAEELSAARGGDDRALIVGRALYIHTPDGFGRSDLAARLTRPSGPGGAGTARNWATVTKLMALLGP